MHHKVTVGLVIAAALCGGCTIMPTSGPQSMDVLMNQSTEPDSLPYGLVKLTPKRSGSGAIYAKALQAHSQIERRPEAFRFGLGDTVSVTIFEAAAGGLFYSAEAGVRPGNFVTIPNQAVDNNGNITVPYAGAIAAKGRTPVEMQQAIVAALKNRAIEPQAVVSLVDQKASLISVLGDVRSAGRFPAAPRENEFWTRLRAPAVQTHKVTTSGLRWNARGIEQAFRSVHWSMSRRTISS